VIAAPRRPRPRGASPSPITTIIALAMSHLTNPLATTEQLLLRSSLSSVPQDLQESAFVAAQCLTQAAGQLLRAPQAVTAQANVLLARYWLVDSLMAHDFSVRLPTPATRTSGAGPADR